ncbi:acyl-CoA-binding domain protein, partial [Trifolium medium]|nr:acyl-CoA-binding domain protein [Trifolium medium]
MSDSILLAWQHNSKVEPVIENGTTYPPETKTISSENGSQVGTQDKDVVVERFGSIGVYDQWIAPPVSGQRPKARYEHGAAAVQDKLYIYGGNHNGRYLSDLHIAWGNKLLSIAGHTKDPSESIQ